MTNPKRGELALELGEKVYHCRINMDVMMRIETNIGRSLLKIANDMQTGDISGLQIISILTPVIRSSGSDVKDADVKKLVWEAGVAEGLRCVAEVIAFVLGGADDDAGNEQQAEQA
jgi:hypothetical protein